MTRMSIEEAKALWLSVNAVSEQEMLVKWALTGLKARMWARFNEVDIHAPKKKNKSLEDDDAERLCSRLKLNKYRFVHTPNESWIWWKVAMIQALKKKRMWLAKGYPDFTIYMHNWRTLHIELKKPRTKKLDWEFKALSSDWISCSDEQKEWIEFLHNRPGHKAFFAFWYDYSLKIIKHHEQLWNK